MTAYRSHPIYPLSGDFEAVVCELVLKGADVNEKCSLTNQNNDLVEGVSSQPCICYCSLLVSICSCKARAREC